MKGRHLLTQAEMIIQCYLRLERKRDLTIAERCSLQRDMREVLRKGIDLEDTDRENFNFHLDHFEEDVYMTIGRGRLEVQTGLATIGLQLDRISKAMEKLGAGDALEEVKPDA